LFPQRKNLAPEKFEDTELVGFLKGKTLLKKRGIEEKTFGLLSERERKKS
jgi:hypothetical protein